MLGVPNEPLPGQGITASDLAQHGRYMKSTMHRGSPGQLVSTGPGGTTQRAISRPSFKQWPTNAGPAASPTWPFKVYNTTINDPIKGHIGQVQINGGDGSVGTLNSFVANVNGNPIDTTLGSPPSYPQLSVGGNGGIYGKVTLTTPGTSAPIASLDITYQSSPPGPDTANPASFLNFLLATISNYAIDGMGNISFKVNNAFGTSGPSTLICCGPLIQIY